MKTEEQLKDLSYGEGTIYHDHSSGGWLSGRKKQKDCWRAEIRVDGRRYRHRSKDRQDCVDWLRSVRQGKIRPWENKADWWRMEQRKDESARIDEIIVSQAEESVLMYDYHVSGDLEPIRQYMMQRLLPHMTYYSAHTLHLGRDRALRGVYQAAGLLLVRITDGYPMLSLTRTFRRMLRTYKERGDFFYYERASETVRLALDGIDLQALSEVYKVTRDRRL